MPLIIEDQNKLKSEREDKAGKLLEEKGKDMNRAEKAFVGNFVKKDATVPVAFIPTKDEHEQK